MYKRVFLTALLSCLVAVSSIAQSRKDKSVMESMGNQKTLLTTIVKELKTNFGKTEMRKVKKLKTKKQFVAYVKKKAEICKKCPVLVAFSKGLKVKESSYPRMTRLTYGQYIGSHYTSYGDDGGDDDGGEEPDPDPDPKDPEPKDTIQDPEPPTGGGSSSDCGPFHCLSWWGEHFPCQGVPGY